MTPLASIKNEVIEQAITGQAVNRAQDRHLVNTTPEIDSLAEILAEIGTLASRYSRTRTLAAEGLRLVKRVRDLNDTEHACAHAIAGHAEAISLDVAREKRMTNKRLAAALRPILADLGNPSLGAERYLQRLDALMTVVAQAQAEHLLPTNATLRHELDGSSKGAPKFTRLHEILDQLGTRP